MVIQMANRKARQIVEFSGSSGGLLNGQRDHLLLVPIPFAGQQRWAQISSSLAVRKQRLLAYG